MRMKAKGARVGVQGADIINNIRYNMQPSVRTSFNGGPGGISAQPRPFEVAAEHERHTGPVASQVAMREQP